MTNKENSIQKTEGVYHIFIGPYTELRKTRYNIYKWELDTLIDIKMGIREKNQLIHLKANNEDIICATTGKKNKKIRCRKIPLSDSYKSFETFMFSTPIKRCWVESAIKKKEYEQDEKISGGIEDVEIT